MESITPLFYSTGDYFHKIKKVNSIGAVGWRDLGELLWRIGIPLNYDPYEPSLISVNVGYSDVSGVVNFGGVFAFFVAGAPNILNLTPWFNTENGINFSKMFTVSNSWSNDFEINVNEGFNTTKGLFFEAFFNGGLYDHFETLDAEVKDVSLLNNINLVNALDISYLFSNFAEYNNNIELNTLDMTILKNVKPIDMTGLFRGSKIGGIINKSHFDTSRARWMDYFFSTGSTILHKSLNFDNFDFSSVVSLKGFFYRYSFDEGIIWLL